MRRSRWFIGGTEGEIWASGRHVCFNCRAIKIFLRKDIIVGDPFYSAPPHLRLEGRINWLTYFLFLAGISGTKSGTEESAPNQSRLSLEHCHYPMYCRSEAWENLTRWTKSQHECVQDIWLNWLATFCRPFLALQIVQFEIMTTLTSIFTFKNICICIHQYM